MLLKLPVEENKDANLKHDALNVPAPPGNLVFGHTKNRKHGNDDDRLSCQLPVHRSSE